ncbi:hypothetical protein HanRHA438_Chr11g0481321 [Helianthus annuus]|nr:hypothetical protein HanRHA438_Chr11g0481321 [Helianthus annuus]
MPRGGGWERRVWAWLRANFEKITPTTHGLKVVSGKVTKHEKVFLDNQHVFIPFAFDTFSFLAPEAVDLFSRIQRVTRSNVMTLKLRSMDVVFERLSFAIKKEVAAQLVSSLSSVSM